ncbi:MAG: radical SAM protein [Nitrospinae bacterium]|nr:radical SAM protein [Nitrospinota bacterium]
MGRLKITFLNPPFLKSFSRPQRSPAVTKSGTLYFPMWLAYACGAADKAGFEVDFMDAPADGFDLDYVKKRVADFAPGLIVADTSTPSVYNDAAVCQTLKDLVPGAFVLLVGTHVTALPEESLKLNGSVGAVAVGEYDQTVTDLAQTLESGGSLKDVAGICWRDGDKTVNNPRREFIEDLDSLPFVSSIYRRFLRIENYFNPNAIPPMVTITTSRGCPYPCSFCVYPQTLMSRKVRYRSVANVVDEIEYITKSFPEAKSIFFEDDTFTINRKRCVEISEEMMRRGINISWTINARADLDYETLRVMKRAGLKLMCVGFESGSQQLLDNIAKKTSVEKMESFMADARKAGVLVHGCFMVGLPGETKETMQGTLDMAKRLNPDTAQFYPIMVYPGTDAYQWYSEKGYLTTKDFSQWLTPGGLHNTIVRTEQLTSEEMVQFCDHARREFYLRPQYIARKMLNVAVNPDEMRRTLRSARTFIKYLVKGSDVAR